MRTFASVWPDREIVQQVVAKSRGGRMSSSWTRSPTATPVYGTIGLLLCKGKDWTVVEYALRGFEKLMGVAQWETMLVDSLPEEAIKRVELRVRQGGHHVPPDVIRRRFASGLQNFQNKYRHIVDYWQWFDNSGTTPILVDEGENP